MTRSTFGGDSGISSSSGRYPTVASRQLVVVVAALAAVAVSALVLLAVLGRGDSNTPTAATSSPAANADATPAKRATAPSASLKVTLPAQGKLGMGNEGATVKTLQRALLAVGFEPGARDGIFGRETQLAVIAFQKKHNLVEDGVVGAKTAAALNAALADR